jgi:hypothetical protein
MVMMDEARGVAYDVPRTFMCMVEPQSLPMWSIMEFWEGK